jgi:anti-sigma regulatory factor (Ser/Thr protein kinase)
MSTDTGPTPVSVADPFVHPALFYSGADDYLEGTIPFLREGIKAGEPVAVAVPGPNLALIRDALGGDAPAVHMLDMRQAGRNPGRIIPGVLRAFADAHQGGGRVRIIGEPIWAGRSALEYPACAQHEALINLAFTGRTVSILCPYDLDSLDSTALEDARVTHPVLWRSGREQPSGDYSPSHIIDGYNMPLPTPAAGPAEITVVSFTEENLMDTRTVTLRQAIKHGMSADRAGDVELVAHELAANSVRHGGGSGVLRLWAEGELFICEVADKGHLTDPLAGRRPAGLSAGGGRGLLLAHHLSDLLRIHSTPEGTAIRAHFRRHA